MSLPIREDQLTRARYSQAGGIQRIIPSAVARPEDEAGLAAVLAWAAARGLGVTPRGAGSAMDGSSIGPGLVLDLTGMPAAIHLDAAARRATVGAGATRAALDRLARDVGLRFGPDPSSGPWATLGGMLAVNAAGPRSHRLGAVDRWVTAVRLLTDDGELTLERGVPIDPDHPVAHRWQHDAAPLLGQYRDRVSARWPTTRKNTAGYGLLRYWASGDLLDLVIGSEGTLGVITSATLRLADIPAFRAALRVSLASRDDLSEAVTRLDRFEPTAIELLDRSLLQFVAGSGTPSAAALDPAARRAAALLLVDFEAADPDELADRVRLAADAVGELGAECRLATDPAEVAALSEVRHLASPLLAGLQDGRRSLQVIEDGCVPVPRLATYLADVATVCARHGVDVVMFGHAGDGHVHVNLLPDLGRADWLAAVRRIHAEVFDRLLALGGTTAGEHGAGRLRAAGLGRLLGEEAVACMAAVKRAFDPRGRFNPGVILNDGSDPFVQLKVGPGAVPLPSGVAEALDRVERERRYAEPRWDG